MKTAEYYIKRALQLILVQASEQPIQSPEAKDTINALNDMMLEYEDTGLPLGFTEVSDLGDDVTIPDYARRMVIYNLAVNVADEYDAILKPGTTTIAQNALTAVERVVISQPISIYPDTLPTGAGNDCGGNYDDVFYPGEEDELILTEQTGNITLESGTEDDS